MSFNWDILGKVIIELRADAGVAAIVSDRVRGYEPAPSDIGAGTDESPYKAFVVAVHLGAQRENRVPVQRPRIALRCYGRTLIEAAQLGTAVSDALHYIGPRLHANGLGIYTSFATDGGEQDKDPDTQQPYVTVFADFTATTQAVTA